MTNAGKITPAVIILIVHLIIYNIIYTAVNQLIILFVFN